MATMRTSGRGDPGQRASDREPGEGARAGRRRRAGADTRERILDVALELFSERGYEATSLRDIAERLGVSKAALYYHFEHKEDIFLELHLRLHELSRDAFDQLDSLPDDRARADAWPSVLDRFIDRVIENPELILLTMRNHDAMEAAPDDERHHAANEDVQQRIGRLLASPDIPLDRRIRIACSLGVIVTLLIASGEPFADVPLAELAEQMRSITGELLGARSPKRARRRAGAAQAAASTP